MEETSKPKLLVLGLNSSLAPGLVLQAKKIGYQVYGTSHRKDLAANQNFGEIEEIFSLQLKNWDQTEIELEGLSKHRFSRIISLIGATWRSSNQSEYLAMSEYYQTLGLNLNLTHAATLKFLDADGTFVYVSSRAAVLGSFDEHYAAVKAANTLYLLSLRNQIQNGQTILPIASSLIETSAMYKEMSIESQVKHRERTGDQLIQIQEVVEALLKESYAESDPLMHNGIYYLGRDF
jgi:NAD(P)-dependent dehydrogenase (short-subunit alcohol dehydrogenase family)